MSASRNSSSAFTAQDDRRDSTSSHFSVKRALRWWANKVTYPQLEDKEVRRSSYDGLMPSPFETKAGYEKRMNAHHTQAFW